tara:strand:+ start:35 stop:343 length:309 start_codon:yes stop_codon:yes gene_type:complete
MQGLNHGFLNGRAIEEVEAARNADSAGEANIHDALATTYMLACRLQMKDAQICAGCQVVGKCYPRSPQDLPDLPWTTADTARRQSDRRGELQRVQQRYLNGL